MTLSRLVWRSLRYYRGTALAVTLGLVVATAVVTGSLVIGDSVTGSLRQTALGRLGRIEVAISSPRPLDGGLVERLATASGSKVTPVLSLAGAATHPTTEAVAPRVRVLGVGTDFWTWYEGQAAPVLEGRQCAVNAALAGDLGLQAGEGLLVTLQPPGGLAADSLFARRDLQAAAPLVRLQVAQVLPAGPGPGDFRADPQAATPRNIFVSREWLSQLLDLPEAANLLLAGGEAGEVETLAALKQALPKAVTLGTYGLRLQPNAAQGHLMLTSVGMMLPEPVVQAAQQVAKQLGGLSSRASVYLATRLQTAGGESAYAMIAGLEPLQAFRVLEGQAAYPTGDEVWLSEWAAADLRARPGEALQLETLVPQPDGRYETTSLQLRVSGLVALQGPGRDPALVPEVRGLTDQATIDSWNAPFPVDLSRITPRDETYWEQHRATPRAYISLDIARRLWRSAPGAEQSDWVTSVRLQPPAGMTLAAFATACETALRQALSPADQGLVVQPLRAQALAAAQGTSDFGQLFLGLSFFLVLSGLGLAAMLLRLALERRSSEAGLLLACGWPARQVRRVQGAEMLVLAVAGAVLGVPAGLGYAALIIGALAHWWGGALGDTPHLGLQIELGSLLSGGVSGLMVGLLACLWSGRSTRRRGALELLAGWQALTVQRASGGGAKWLGVGCLLAAGLLLTGAYGWGQPAPTAAFFGVGLLLLVAGLAGARVALAAGLQQPGATRSPGRLARRNVAAGGKRSLLVMGLLASATFIVVAVAANTRDLSRLDPTDSASGTGGFTLRAEASVPLPFDPATAAGREKLGFSAADEALVAEVKIISLRASPGEDISCLNIARPQHPRLLGIPESLITRGGFTLRTSEPGEWALLTRPDPTGAVPAFGDADSVRWSLHSGLGQTYELTGVAPPVTLRFAGLVQGSIFARELLVSEANLRRLYPTVDRPSVLLIETLRGREAAVAEVLRRQLGQLGVEVRLTGEILNDFLRVQNTYLAMFLALGALGVMLGTVGLVLVMQRSALERRGEWALLLATGWTPARLGWLLLAEFTGLLLAGLLLGVLCALVAVGPQLVAATSAVNWPALFSVVSIIALTGVLAAWRVARQTCQGDLIGALRAE